MKKNNYTTILEFEVINQQNDMGYISEKLELSSFGEYCPDTSLRGYSLEYLLRNNQNYKPTIIIQQGIKITIN